MKMKKRFIVFILVFLIYPCAIHMGNNGIVLRNNSGIALANYDPVYRAQLVRWLEEAEKDLANAQKDYDWDVEHNTGTIMGSYRVAQAQRHVDQCKQRLYEYDLNNPS
ncbi:MAG TPA: hypothetical protein DDW65_07035 [Firmicutes bacterium]|jgi:hypothetical protein|nr:hypothetical protein [Bacillota bacterium]